MLTLAGAIGFRLLERLSFAGICCVTLLHGIWGRLVADLRSAGTPLDGERADQGINFVVELRARAMG